MVMGRFGFNLNASVSTFLNGFHNQVTVAYYKYTGETNTFGKIKSTYAPGRYITVQQQQPSPAALEYVRKELDIRYVKQFWMNEEVMPAVRVDGKGGDLIWYDGYIWYLDTIPDDFRQVGWISAIGVMTFDPRPA